jgi:hypothetical protein
MKAKFLSIIFILGLIFSNSCTKDFDEINSNPNSPSADQAAPEMLLTNAIESMTDRVHEIFLGHEMGSGWVQHMAKVQYTDEDRYIYRPDVLNNTWNSLYAASGMDIHTISRIAKANELNNYLGVSYVLKAYVISLLTDLFGDVPYTEAFVAVDDVTKTLPKYDSQESIYRDLISKLDSANTVLLSDDNESIQGDILYAGDVTKWKKFANSLRMRLLLRMSSKDAQFVTAELSKMVADPATYPIFASNAEHASLAYLGSAPNNHPINENRKTRDDHRLSQTLIDFMYTDNPLVDWRVVAYAELAGSGDFVGLPNGLTSSEAAGYLGNGLSETSKLGTDFTAASAPGILLSYAEVQFILAEAAVKGFIPGGLDVAKTYYENGILGSYQQNEATIIAKSKAYFSAYVNTASITTIYQNYLANGGAWTATDQASAMQKIGYEKWVALFGQGLQAFIEWRRLGIPALTAPAGGNNAGKIPSRYPYPTNEKTRNGSNLEAAVAAQGFGALDDLNGKVWWNK